MPELWKILFIAASAVAAFLIQSFLLRAILLYVDPKLKIKRYIELRDVGTWIGLNEFALIMLFVFVNEYTAIAIIFAAKEIVRSEKIKENPSYYLLGTLLNVVLSLLSSLAIKQGVARLFEVGS